VEEGIADFSGGRYYDNFVPGQLLSEEERRGRENEAFGAAGRVAFYRPLLDRLARERRATRLRVLDCGCGDGLSVDLWSEAGFEAWGNDLSALRKWQWRERRSRDRLVVADSGKLPFAAGFFDAVICSGVLEHVGVAEEGGAAYRVRALPEKDASRRRFLGELLRVSNGRLWLDFPNGAFPIDFWHGAAAGAARLHSRREGFLPTVAEVRGHLAVLSPQGRLRFRQVSRQWYGRLLAPLAAAYLRLLSLPGADGLRASGLNPFLVLEIEK
jgi:SAM-dependent methyltransferase